MVNMRLISYSNYVQVIFDSPTGTMERQQSSGTPAASSGEPSLDLNEVRSGKSIQRVTSGRSSKNGKMNGVEVVITENKIPPKH